jgi:AcrR family transcriptional regulator
MPVDAVLSALVPDGTFSPMRAPRTRPKRAASRGAGRTYAAEEQPCRQRILDAAFAAMMERGYYDTSTLEIATRARVSKRELYALIGSKQDILIACIDSRAERMRSLPPDAPEAHDRDSLLALLSAFGAQLLREATHPAVVGMHRLAIAEANRAPEVARALQSKGRGASRAALREILLKARSAGLISGDTAELTEQFMALLWGDIMMNLLLRSAEAPGVAEIRRRAESAAKALLLLHPA